MKRFSTISQFHEVRNLARPEHPLFSIFKIENVEPMMIVEPVSWTYDFYCLALKRVSGGQNVKLKYGQHTYDYNEGIMSCVSPNQVLSLTVDDKVDRIIQSGWMLLIHPDFLWNTPLAKTIKQYDFWDYTVHEALFVSEKEEAIIINLLQNIEREYHSNIDQFSKSIIISHLEALFNYADRFYHRQFITREKSNHQVLDRLEELLNDHFNNDDLAAQGLPTVSSVAQSLNLSPKYLSSLLKVLTGQNTQQHIHEKLIEKAKEKLTTTNFSISEIAYQLGFEHLQSFSKLFKTKTRQSPMEFRATFN